MNIKSIFAAIIMFIANILSSVKDLYNSIFNGKVDISNSTTVPEIPITDTEYIADLTTVPEIPITDTTNIINPTTVPETPITDKTIPDSTNVLICTKEKEISYNVYFEPCDSSIPYLSTCLESIGEKSDASYRTKIAHLNGMEDYSKTAEQNELLLKKLKDGTLIKSIETKIETITFPCDNEAKSDAIEIIPTTIIEKEKDLKVIVTSLLKEVEGVKGCKAYKDGRGFATIGIGKLCAGEVKVETQEQIDIKCDKWIKLCKSNEDIQYEWLDQDIDSHLAACKQKDNFKKAYDNCNIFRKAILISMCYQMGPDRVATFKKALYAMYIGDWNEAAKEMLNSDWHNKKDQSPKRAEDHAQVMKTGECAPYCSLKGWS